MMKKLLISLVLFLCTVSFSHAGVLASGSVTCANKRLSMVNGTAFVDFSTANVLTDYVGKKLVITDSTGKKAIGYIKAQGTGETLGDELVVNGGFDSDTTGWTPGNSALLSSVAGGQSGNCLQITENGVDTPYAVQLINTFTGGLFKFNSLFAKGGTATYINFYLINTTAWRPFGLNNYVLTGSWVNPIINNYYTSDFKFEGGKGNLVIRAAAKSGSGLTALFDTVSIKQVLTPSATGVTITSSPNGSTYNWASIESGFNYNDASGYTYTIVSGGKNKKFNLGKNFKL